MFSPTFLSLSQSLSPSFPPSSLINEKMSSGKGKKKLSPLEWALVQCDLMFPSTTGEYSCPAPDGAALAPTWQLQCSHPLATWSHLPPATVAATGEGWIWELSCSL